MRSVQLFVPDLVPDPPDPAIALSRFPALHRLLSRARRQRYAAEHFEALLCMAFGLRPQRDDYPVAALTLLADGGTPANDFWLRADPVHLHARHSDLVLVESERLEIEAAEAAALTESLNRHFAEEDLAFSAPVPNRWYLRVPAPVQMRTVPPRHAAGRSVDPLLPDGTDALVWHRRANEAQMLLHDHRVNQEREGRRAPTINSLWFWGGGRIPDCTTAPESVVWAEDALARGLAACAKRPLESLPRDAGAWLERATQGRHLVLLEPARGGSWDQRMAHLEIAWFAPLVRALSRGAMGELELISHHAGHALRFGLSRGALWKFWRKGFALTAYA